MKNKIIYSLISVFTLLAVLFPYNTAFLQSSTISEFSTSFSSQNYNKAILKVIINNEDINLDIYVDTNSKEYKYQHGTLQTEIIYQQKEIKALPSDTAKDKAIKKIRTNIQKTSDMYGIENNLKEIEDYNVKIKEITDKNLEYKNLNKQATNSFSDDDKKEVESLNNNNLDFADNSDLRSYNNTILKYNKKNLDLNGDINDINLKIEEYNISIDNSGTFDDSSNDDGFDTNDDFFTFGNFFNIAHAQTNNNSLFLLKLIPTESDIITKAINEIEDSINNLEKDGNTKTAILNKLKKNLKTLKTLYFGVPKMLPPLTFTFEEVEINTNQDNPIIETKVIEIEETNTRNQVNILQLQQLAQSYNLEILPGSSEVDGVATANDSNKSRAKIIASDIGEDSILIDAYNTYNSAFNDVYDGRGSGVNALSRGEIKGVIQTDNSDELFSGIINFFLAFVGVIMVLMFIYAGFLYITAGGNEDRHDKAMNIIIYSLIGVIVIIGSYTLSNTLLSLSGANEESVRIELKLGASVLLGASLSDNTCMYTGSVVGSVQICNEQNLIMIKTPLASVAWPVEEVKGTCKKISVFSACIDEEI